MKFILGILLCVNLFASACPDELVPKRRKLWLSRQRDGNYMLTLVKPLKRGIMGTEIEEFYVMPGEPIGVRHLCPGGVACIFGVNIERGTQIRVWAQGGAIEDVELDDDFYGN